MLVDESQVVLLGAEVVQYQEPGLFRQNKRPAQQAAEIEKHPLGSMVPML
jgi:hypothetical protein